jgi:AraC-like DNA-binding protein
MLQTEAPLSDIALRCGFTDQAHLCKHFRLATGETPAAWRRARRSQDLGSSASSSEERRRDCARASPRRVRISGLRDNASAGDSPAAPR